MSYSTYYLKAGDEVPCMSCGDKFTLGYEPPKCCRDKQDSALNMCGCQCTPEPIFSDTCWKELEDEFREETT